MGKTFKNNFLLTNFLVFIEILMLQQPIILYGDVCNSELFQILCSKER